MTQDNTPETSDSVTNSDDNQQLRLITVLYSLETLIQRQTSLRYAFVRGAIYGLGTVVGATLLLALFGGVLAATISSLAELPLIGDFVNQDASQELISQ